MAEAALALDGRTMLVTGASSGIGRAIALAAARAGADVAITYRANEAGAREVEAAIRAIGRVARQRTTLYERPDARRTRLSFAAPPLAEPLNPRVNDAQLRRPARLVRPGVAAAAAS